MAHLHIIAGIQESPPRPEVRRIGARDVFAALARGWEDFWTMPSHLAFICLLYPVAGVILAAISSGENALHLIYPLLAGFALIGPFAAVGVYELSRRREAGLDCEWTHAFDALRSPAILSILALGAALAALFVGWLASAYAIYRAIFGDANPPSIGALISQAVSTPKGWTLIVAGNAVGFGFAVIVLSISIVSFQLLLDRDVGAGVAVETSLRATARNPLPIALWGVLVAVSLAVGLGLAFVGLMIALPVLGHASWHLYRLVVGPDEIR